MIKLQIAISLPDMNWDTDCAIIGAGPAGLMSAIYLRRFLRQVVIYSDDQPRAAFIPRTHNLLGYYRGITGKQLLTRLWTQANALHVERMNARATVQPQNNGFKIESEKGSLLARKVILATGIEDLQPNLENLETLRSQGQLRYCPICDAYEYRHESIAVLAQDNHGLREALFLTDYSSKVHVVVPASTQFDSQLQNQLIQRGAHFFTGTLRSIEPRKQKGVWISLDNQQPFLVSVVYVALGAQMKDVAFKSLNILRSEDNRLLTDDHQRLSLPNLFAAGDAAQGLAQLAVAAAHAAIAATTIHNELKLQAQ